MVVRIATVAWLGHIVLSGGISPSQSLLGVALLACIIGWSRGALRPGWHPVLVPMAIYVVASWVSALLSPAPLAGLDQANEWFHFATFAVALALIRTRPHVSERAIAAIAVLTAGLALIGAWQYFVLGHRTLEQRITGPAAHVMTYSGLVLIGTIFIGVIALHRRSVVYGAAAALGTFALALTFTRGAWVAWIAGALVWLVMHRSRWIAWSAPIALIFLVVAPMPIFSRVVSAFDTQQASNFDRIRMAEAGIEMIRDQPLTGVGPGRVKETYPLYRSEDAPRFRIPHLHNNPVQIWAERGLGAFMASVALFLLLANVFMKARRDPHRGYIADAALATMAAFLVAGLFEFNFGDTEVLLALLDVMAIACATLETGGVTAPS